MTLKLCVAQLNFMVGDLQGNAQKIIAAAREAYSDGVRLAADPRVVDLRLRRGRSVLAPGLYPSL
jgi:predicted amidohydrolase